MPPQRQPKHLQKLCVTAVSDMIINQIVTCPQPEQVQNMKELVNKVLPPVLIQEVLSNVAVLLGSVFVSQACPTVLSSLMGILLHPKLNEVNLSDLTYIGYVGDEFIDMFELSMVKQLPLMSQLTHVDLSTHCSKTTLPVCSDKILKVLAMSCPNLEVMNLNFNEKVSSAGLSFLYPSDDHVGCGKLNRLYIQDCDIVSKEVADILCNLPNLEIVGYRRLGESLKMLKSSSAFRDKFKQLKLTHIDNTSSRTVRSDGDIVTFIVESCPNIENLRIRLSDEDFNEIHRLEKLRHLDVRFYTRHHFPMGSGTQKYLTNYGENLTSLTIYCACLYSRHMLAIAENCINLRKLYLHANRAEINDPLTDKKSLLKNLEVLQLRLGDNELVMHDIVPISFLVFLISKTKLEELYLMIRSSEFGNDFLTTLVMLHCYLEHLRILIVDVPKRTMAAPMLDLSISTAYTIMHNLKKLKTLGNLICWSVTPEEVEELQTEIRKRNFNLNIIYSPSTKRSTKYF